MQIILGDKIVTEQPTDVYVVKVDMMHGDADGYSENEMHIPIARVDILQRTLELFKEMDARRGTGRDYDDILDFNLLFGSIDDYNEDYGITEEEWDDLHSYGFEWERDHTCEDYNAGYAGHTITYFNSLGEEFEVEIKL